MIVLTPPGQMEYIYKRMVHCLFRKIDMKHIQLNQILCVRLN